jgi:hypothetical protein
MDANEKAAMLLQLRKSFSSSLKESNGVVSDANLDKLLAAFNKVSIFGVCCANSEYIVNTF